MSIVYFGENNFEFEEYKSACRVLNNIEIWHSFSEEINE